MVARKTQAPSRARRTPRYRRIADTLLREIASGRHPVGGLLPTEAELCKRFRASRYTVREALRVITGQGLLVRRPGAGSIVVAAAQPAVFTQRVDSLDAVLSYPPDTYRESRSEQEVVARGGLARQLGCPSGTRWFRISALRRSRDAELPLAWTDIYVQPQYAGVVKSRSFGTEPVYAQLERLYGVSTERARVEMYASRVPRSLAQALAVKAGSPAMTVVRRHIDRSGENFETTVTVHPEGRFTYSMELRRELRGAR